MSELNPAQQRAVDHTGGPLLILAGAGSGKTRVVTHRMARLVREGADPRHILAVTFTNKAAREMKERAAGLIGAAAEQLRVATFHSTCARLLRRHARVVGLTPSFSIYDEDDQLVLVRQLAEDLGLPHDASAARDARARIEAARHEALDVHEVRTRATTSDDEAYADLFDAYEQALLRANAVDFGGLISHVATALEFDEGFRTRVRSATQHLLVDEFQDTNVAQYLLVKRLAPDSGDVAVVGDDDQAIYGWRGATVANVLRFRDEFDGCEVVALEQNYRSGPVILEAANAIVERLPSRMEKTLWTARTDRRPVAAFVGSDDREEADFVAREIERVRRSDNVPYDGFAIFFRTNAQSRSFEERFRALGLPHALRGAQAWFDRREIRDLSAYLRLAANPADEVALRRVANVPSRGVGKGTLRKLIAFHDAAPAGGYAASIRAFVESGARLQSRTRSGLRELAELLDSIATLARSASASEVLETILTETDFEEWLVSSDAASGDDRVRNVRDLLASAGDFAERNDDDSVTAFLEQIALVATPDEDGPGVQLMSVHAAKGLEFPVVFVTGLEDGQFPLVRRTSETDPDEERRLAYVAFTRARDRLYVTAAKRRRLFGQTRETDPSPFLQELPEDLVEMAPESSARDLDWRAARVSSMRSSARRRAPEFDFDQRSWQERHADVPEAGLVFGDDASTEAPPAPSGRYEGKTAHHKLFGAGLVCGASVKAGKEYLTIEFSAPHGRKEVARKYVEVS